jgi:hypothetical protein
MDELMTALEDPRNNLQSHDNIHNKMLSNLLPHAKCFILSIHDSVWKESTLHSIWRESIAILNVKP